MLNTKLVKHLKNYLINIIKAPYYKLISEISEPNGVAWFETLVVSSVMIMISWLINPNDLLFLNQDFPWLLLAPLFLALRHGFMFGFVSALFFAGIAIFMWRFGGIKEDFSVTMMLGSLIVISLTGEFSDFWQRRLGRVETESNQRDRRMEEFTRSYHLLRVSHDQLVEQLAGSSVSLRQAIEAIRKEMLDNVVGSANPLEAGAARILSLFRRYGDVQSASLHRIEDGVLNIESLGRLGAVLEDTNALNDSRIIDESLIKGEMMTVLTAENGAPQYEGGNILASVPLGDLSGKIWALLVVYRIPFLKFTEDNLSLIAVMGSYLGDMLCELDKSLQGDEAICEDFYSELKHSIRYARLYDMHAKLVSVELPEANDEAFETLLSFRRSMDKILVRKNHDGHSIALWLMPFCDDFAVAGFQARINRWAREIFHSEFSDDLVVFHTFDLNGKHRSHTVMEEVEHVCHLADS